MNAVATIQDLIEATIADNHRPHCVRFMDELLAVAAEAGEIACTLATDRGLRFQIGDQPAWEVEVGRAKSKLRMLCARLAVLCQESGCDFMLYGGDGTIRRDSLAWKARWTNTPGKQDFTITAVR